jgi:hypothetical protein
MVRRDKHCAGRLRSTVLASHEPEEINRTMEIIGRAGKEIGII